MEYEAAWPSGYSSCSMSANGLRWVCLNKRALSDLYLIKDFEPSIR